MPGACNLCLGLATTLHSGLLLLHPLLLLLLLPLSLLQVRTRLSVLHIGGVSLPIA